MLAILYIISILFSILTVFLYIKREYKDSLATFCIAISTEIIYSLIVINNFRNNMFDPNFATVFGFLSLVFVNFAIFSGNIVNWLDYIVCALIGSVVICFIFSNIYFTDYYVNCNENHDYSECIPIITTIDGSKDGESIYGEGFTIGLIIKPNPNIRIYEFYYQKENGQIVKDNFHESRVELTYISTDEEPYAEINYDVNCIGYRRNSKTHTFSRIIRTCHFYIPKNSIASLQQNS